MVCWLVSNLLPLSLLTLLTVSIVSQCGTWLYSLSHLRRPIMYTFTFLCLYWVTIRHAPNVSQWNCLILLWISWVSTKIISIIIIVFKSTIVEEHVHFLESLWCILISSSDTMIPTFSERYFNVIWNIYMYSNGNIHVFKCKSEYIQM